MSDEDKAKYVLDILEKIDLDNSPIVKCVELMRDLLVERFPPELESHASQIALSMKFEVNHAFVSSEYFEPIMKKFADVICEIYSVLQKRGFLPIDILNSLFLKDEMNLTLNM